MVRTVFIVSPFQFWADKLAGYCNAHNRLGGKLAL